MNSKQVVATVSVILLLVILVYPAISTGTVSVVVRSMSFDRAEHVFVVVNGIWIHQERQVNSTGWMLVSNETQTIDLISLQDSTKLLGTGQVSVANYDSVRVGISNVTWVFNKTTTTLSPLLSQVDANVEFTVSIGRESSITVVMSGHQEVIGSTKYFVPNLNATVTGAP